MAGEECVPAMSEAAEPRDTHTPRLVFLVPTLDSSQQRHVAVTKIQEFIASESIETGGGVAYLGQAGWEETGQVWSLTSHLMSACRRHRLLPSERCVLLSLHDQYQAIQLCLARINKVRQGEFMAAASDVLDVWNAMYRETVTGDASSKAETEALEELNHLSASQESCDPMKRELQEVIKDYREFLTTSLSVDHFMMFKCLQELLKNDLTLFRDMLSKVYIMEGLEQLPIMERELLKLVSEGSQVYRVCAELPFSYAAPHSPSTLNISGIHETNNLQTPSRHNKQQTDESDVMADDSKETHSPQTPSQQDRQQANQKGSASGDSKNTDTPQTPSSHSKHQTDPTDTMENDTKDADSQETAVVQVERVEESLKDLVDGAPRYPPKAFVSSESEAYIERLFLAHLRLLVNTRDELALTLACSMPGREINHQAFTDIRQEAQRMEMPMYQTIMTFILRQRLGGKGYQPEHNNPVLLHARPLGEFVNALLKLHNIHEGQTDPREGAVRVVSGIKTGLSKMKGCMLKRSTIEAVADRLSMALRHLIEAAGSGDSASAKQDNCGSSTPSNLHPSLKYLIHLCDVAGGQAYRGGVVDALGDDLLTQLSSSKKGPQTPVRVPSVLSLFRSPAGVVHEKRGEKGVEEDEGEELETRVKRKMGKATTAAAQPKRYKSECSWAPNDLSPIDAQKLNPSASPVSGASLMAVGRAAKPSSEGWKEIVASVTQKEDDSTPSLSQTSSSPAKPSSPATPRAPKEDNDKPKKVKSKRSLLKDISNMGSKSKETQGKKQKVQEGSKEGAKRKKGKNKPLLQGQRSITSFFRP